MEIINRNIAIAYKLPRYFTGKVCVNNHRAERFTTNGNCIECQHPPKPSPELARHKDHALFLRESRSNYNARVMSARALRRDAISTMVLVWIQASYTSWPRVAKMALSLAQLRAPLLCSADISKCQSPREGCLWQIKAYADDVPFIREYAASLSQP